MTVRGEQLLRVSALVVITAVAALCAVDGRAADVPVQQTQFADLEMLEDTTAELPLETAVTSTDWHAVPTLPINLLYSSSAYWLRFHLRDKATDPSFLVVQNPLLYNVDLYIPRADGTFAIEQRGFGAGNENEFGSRHFVYDLASAPSAAPLYMRVASQTPLQIPMTVLGRTELAKQAQRDNFLFGIFVGILAAFPLYNLLIFAYVRHKMYLFYAIYGLGMACVVAFNEGIATPHFGHALRPFILHGLGGIAVGSLATFTRYALLTRRHLPRMDAILRVLVVGCIIVPLLTIIHENTLWLIGSHLLGFGTPLTCLVAAALSLRKRAIAKFLLLAFAMPNLGIAIFILQQTGLVPSNDLTQHGVHVGIALEVILFSQALAHRITILNRRIVAKSTKLKRLNKSLVREIARRKRIAEELEEQRAIVVHTAKMRALGNITASVAHEINTPLAVLKLRIESLRRYVDQPPDAVASVESLHTIADSSARMIDRIAKVVKSLLGYARNAVADAPERILPQRIIDDLLDICQASLVQRSVRLEVATMPERALYCRPSEITQILLNLVNNAADALTEHVSDDRRIVIRCGIESECGVFHVDDSGPGVPAELVPSLMKSSFTTKEKGKGTGLGLGISKMLAERNGGTLTYSRADGMTRFSLTIPLAPKETGPQHSAA
jgi:signal transduction histidine kinase